MSKRTLVLIYTNKQFRTYVESGAFKNLSQKGETTFILRQGVGQQEDFKSEQTIFIPPFPKFLHRSGTFLATLLLWKNRFRSPAHTLRAHASFGNRRVRTEFTSMILYNMEGWSEIKRLLIRFFSLILPRKILIYFRFMFVKRFLFRNFISAGLELENYANIFIPFSGLLTREFDDFIDYFNSRNLVTIALQENWDNLSSKTFIESKPKYFCVWGMQSAAHLRTVHRLNDSIPIISGSPRFLPYNSSESHFDQYKKIPPSLELSINRNFVLFTGTGDGIDDFFILDQTIEGLKFFTEFQLVYRPHPFTRNPLSEEKVRFLLENQVSIDSSDISKSVFHHCGLILNASLVINQFSTMLLETLACERKVLLPTFVNRNVNYDYSRAVDEWFHFIGLSAFPNVYISKNKNRFREDLRMALTAQEIQDRKASNWMCSELDSREIYFKLVEDLKTRQ